MCAFLFDVVYVVLEALVKYGGSVVHVDVKECAGQNRALGDHIWEISSVR